MDKNKETLKTTFAEAVHKYQKKDFKTAEIYCYKILSINPHHFDSLSLLATISAINNNFEKAKELILKAIEIQPKNLKALNNLGTAYKKLGNIKEAIDSYKKVLIIEPNHTNANFNLGISFYELGELKKAKNYLKKTVEIQNNYAAAYYSLANVHYDLKETSDAISCYQKAIEINPNLVSAHNNLGLLFRDLNDFENAIDSYQKAIKVNPSHVSSQHNLALAYKEVGKFKEAITYHQLAIKLEPENLMHDFYLCDLKKDLLNSTLIKKVKKILEKENPSFNNLAYGNYLLAKQERKNKNYEKELNLLIKGHQNFYNIYKKRFDLNNKYCFDDIHQIMNGAKIEKTSKKSDIDLKPIFIIGVPRSGSTLVERIISSSEKFIPVGEETGVIGNYMREKVLEMQSLNLGKVVDIRRELLDIYKKRGLVSKKYDYIFTDKSLDNFFHLEIIREIYPKCKIINCNRNILSSIMSIFQNNLIMLAWSHSLDNIFKYFDNYFEIIENYNATNPNVIYELNFEKLINNPEEESKKLMSYCELPWNIKCLDFYKRDDLYSKTASNVQIREKIYKHSLEKYLPYKKFLDKYGKKYSWFN